MRRRDTEPAVVQAPLADIERHLLAAFLAGAGHGDA